MAKVLIVDDDPPVRELLSQHLVHEGFQVIIASNGMQAVALARAERPALVLLDVELPLLDGWQVARRLRALAETRAIPIIALTGASFPSLDQLVAAAGCDAHEAKPINLPQLIAKVRWLARSEPAPELPAFQPSAG